MHNILLKIIEKKKHDLISSHPDLRLERFQKAVPKSVRGNNKFKKAIVGAKKIALIGEIKFASPTNPSLGSKEELLPRAKLYAESGVDAISIITEPHFFKGDVAFISQVKKVVKAPILQKDFVIDAFQIYQAEQIGSDALLLIARLLDEEALKIFVSLCLNLGIEPVVEINDEADLKKALATETKVIAVNARNLETFVVNVDAACSLLKKIPKHFITLGFSGVVSANEVLQYKAAGAKGVLVGTNLMKAKDVKTFLKSLRVLSGVTPVRRSSFTSFSPGARRGTPTPATRINKVMVKICGVRDLKNAQGAIDAGADFIGFNFVPTSKRYSEPAKAKQIISKLKKKTTKIVGVFQDSPSEEVNKIASLLQLDFVQLHGNEDLVYRKKIKSKIIQRIHTDGSFTDKEKTEYFLLDRMIQGKGKMINLSVAKDLAAVFPTFVAGGLTPENIARVVKKVKPFAVDVAGGIETNGKQDLGKIKLFIKNAKGSNI
jgi:indole-3-glycerol phosphate synthase/phosphoribosylanthranilate isomerase